MVGDAYPHPFPTSRYAPPYFDSQDDAAHLIAAYQAAGHIKRCAHAEVLRVIGQWRDVSFQVHCAEESFRIVRNEQRGARDYDFYGCPVDCRLYRPAWREKARMRLTAATAPVLAAVVGVGKWYASLAPAAQTILALAVLLLVVGASWREVILEIVNKLVK